MALFSVLSCSFIVYFCTVIRLDSVIEYSRNFSRCKGVVDVRKKFSGMLLCIYRTLSLVGLFRTFFF